MYNIKMVIRRTVKRLNTVEKSTKMPLTNQRHIPPPPSKGKCDYLLISVTISPIIDYSARGGMIKDNIRCFLNAVTHSFMAHFISQGILRVLQNL